MDSTTGGMDAQDHQPLTDADIKALARLVEDRPADLDAMSDHWRPLAQKLRVQDRVSRWRDVEYEFRDRPDWEDIQARLNALRREARHERLDGEREQARPVEGEATNGSRKAPALVIRRLSEVKPLTVEWLWRDRIPMGMLTMFAGDPKQGKSFVTVALAATVSRGASFPHGDVPPGPGSAVLLSAEDDTSRTIVPRLKSAGADLSKVYVVEAVKLPDGNEALPSLASDIDRIAEAVENLGDCRLVVVDPITAYVGGVDDHRNAELRGVLSPLKAMAERLNVAVVLVNHLNKGTGTNGRHRVSGSIAYLAACRANFMFARDHGNPARALMLDNGCNLAGDVPTLAYRIEDRGEGPVVEWENDPVPITVEEALRAAAEDRREGDHDEARECDRWLTGTLGSGPVEAKEIYAAGKQAGFSEDQLKRAKTRIGAISTRSGFGKGSTYLWSMPHDADAWTETAATP